MRVAITLQSLDPTWGGIGVYTGEIVRHLLKRDETNEYVLLYPGFGAPRKLRGQYRKFKNATEVETEFSRIPSGLYWDQVIVPRIAGHHGIDVLFNPFLSVPIRGRFKKVMILHAVEYHTVPRVYDWKLYARWFLLEKAILPAADRLISISHVMTQDLQRVLRYPADRIRTVYHGVSDRFRVIEDVEPLQNAKEEYQLPDHFILFVGHVYPQKNFATLVRAFHRIAGDFPHELIVAGRPRWQYRADLDLIDELGLRSRVRFLYWVPHRDLPAIYNLASCFVYPSLYEAFGLAMVEALACGCPVIAARAGAIPEVSGGACVLVDPLDARAMADAIARTISDADFRQGFIDRGLARAKEFSWDRCARETLQVITDAASSPQ